MSELDFENPHYCPVYDKVIDIDCFQISLEEKSS